MHTQKLLPEDLNWIGARFLDPVTKTFFFEGSYYKAIKPGGYEFISFLLQENVFKKLYVLGLMPRTYVSKFEVEGYPMVLAQDTEFFSVLPERFTLKTLHDAALAYCSINQALLPLGLGLRDGHSWNFVLQGKCRPVWCDVGSLLRCSPTDHVGFPEFIQYLVYPLMLRAKHADFGRLTQFFAGCGCTDGEALLLLGGHLQTSGPREHILRQFQDMLQSMTFPREKTTWSEYHDFDLANLSIDANSYSNKDHVRLNLLKRLIKTMHPRHIVDFGSNAGLFTILAAQTGAEVLACEIDATAAEKCAENIQKAPGDLRAKVSMTAFGEPLACVPDLVLVLALTHHLFFKLHFKFDDIAKYLASYTTQAVITEFMPYGLGCGAPHVDPLPQDYDVNIFLAELRKYFATVELVEYPGYPQRQLIVAKKGSGHDFTKIVR